MPVLLRYKIGPRPEALTVIIIFGPMQLGFSEKNGQYKEYTGEVFWYLVLFTKTPGTSVILWFWFYCYM